MSGRHEFKYIINEELANIIKKEAGDRLVSDVFGEGDTGTYIISSLYFDNDNLELYHQTYNRDNFRIKLRLRVYGETNSPESNSFFETKSKLCGESVKIRCPGTLGDSLALAEGKREPSTRGEVDIVNFISRMRLKPIAVVSYERDAFLDPLKPRLRITFDKKLRIRMDDLDLTHGTYGTPVMTDGFVVLEVKNDENIPKWLCDILAKYKLMNQSYSKYGQIGQLIHEYKHPAAGVYVVTRPIMTVASQNSPSMAVQLR